MQFQSKEQFLQLRRSILFKDNYTKQEMDSIVDYFRQLYPEPPSIQFNEHGLRYSLDHLQSIGLQILSFPLFLMETYADIVTVNDPNLFVKELIDFVDDIKLDQLNTTSIGNLAYISVHGNEEVKATARKALLLISDKYFDSILTEDNLQKASQALNPNKLN